LFCCITINYGEQKIISQLTTIKINSSPYTKLPVTKVE